MSEQTEHFTRAGFGQDVLRPASAFCAHAVAKLADFILPPRCLVCRAPVQGHGGLCAKCWPGIDFIEPPRCDRLGIPLPVPSDGPVVSAAALADPPVYDRARAVARYDGAMRELVHALKYGDRHEGVTLFSRWMIHAGADVLEDADVIVPVPLARTRLWGRRFNQAALLARAVGRAANIPDKPFALERIRRTPSQVGLSAEQRRRNVAGAFRVPGRRRAQVAERNIVIVDDVITTGATANACARTLKRAGAARVDVLALARVVDPLTPRL
ncbi:MAG: ComF family protein [Methyloligellaceae bacterium]